MGKPSSDMILRHVIGRSNSSTDVPYFRRTNNKSKIYAEEKGRISLQGTTIEEAVTHLASHLAKKFPASTFAGWWMNNFREESR